MDSQLENKLYQRFPHIYREKNAPLESSKMGWGFQCEDGWYKIIYEMSRKIQRLSGEGDFAPAITEVSKNLEDGALYIEARNLTPPVADIITAAREQSRLTCELCSYSPAFYRGQDSVLKGHIACGRCLTKTTRNATGSPPKRKRKRIRAPDTIIIKR